MSHSSYTIELPPVVARRVARAAKRERRDPVDLAVDALQLYLSFSVEIPTAAELRAMKRGEAAFEKGDFSTLDAYFQSVGDTTRRARKKIARARSAT